MQLVGKDLPADLSDDEREEVLRKAFAGQKCILFLDDLWDASHEAQLNFVDPNSDSRVVISTRIRALLEGAASVQLPPPSDEEATRILMCAAGMKDSTPPREAAELISLCGCLPLALVMAGRLIAELGLGGRWDGVSTILREELRDNEQASSEQRVIRASLAGLQGSARDKIGINNVFALFALVPEDTVCPLETLALMYGAIYGDTTVTLLHIRKWLKQLIDRQVQIL